MAKLRCDFCGTTWSEDILEVLSCPGCELGVAEYVVTEVSNEEIIALWKRVDVRLPKQVESLTESSVYYRTQSPQDLIFNLDLLALLYDRVLVSEVWEAIPKVNPSVGSRFLQYVENGVFVPVSIGSIQWVSRRPPSDQELRGEKLDDFTQRIVDSGFHVDVPRHFGHDFVSALEKLSEVLTGFDYRRDGIDLAKAMHILTSSGGFYVADSMAVTMVLKFINRAMTLGQIFGAPVALNRAYEDIVEMKAGRGGSVGQRLQLMNRFLSDLRVHVPSSAPVDDLLSFRRSGAARQLRETITGVLNSAQAASDTELAYLLRNEYQEVLFAYNHEAQRFGKTHVAVVSGAMATLGGLIGGPMGATIGGAGSAASGLLLGTLYQKMYERTHSNWAFFFHRWRRNVQ